MAKSLILVVKIFKVKIKIWFCKGSVCVGTKFDWRPSARNGRSCCPTRGPNGLLCASRLRSKHLSVVITKFLWTLFLVGCCWWVWQIMWDYVIILCYIMFCGRWDGVNQIYFFHNRGSKDRRATHLWTTKQDWPIRQAHWVHHLERKNRRPRIAQVWYLNFSRVKCYKYVTNLFFCQDISRLSKVG